MEDIRKWMFSVAVTLIITGVVSKLVPERNNKSVLNFVTVLVILITVFSIDTDNLEHSLKFDFANSNTSMEISQDKLNSEIKEILSSELKDSIRKTVSNYAPYAKTEIEIKEDRMIVIIESNNLTDSIKTAIEKEIKDNLEGNIEFIYRLAE